MIRSFGETICAGKTNIHRAEVAKVMIKFNSKSRPKAKEDKDKKQHIFNGVNALYKGQKLTFNAFRSGMFPVKEKKKKRKGLKIFTHKQMLRRLITAPA